MIRLQLNKIKYIYVYNYIFGILNIIYLPVIVIYYMITITQNILKNDNEILYHLITFEHNVSHENNCIYSRLITTYRVATRKLIHHMITINNYTSPDTNGLMYTM
jgi:hypothetical protein